MWEQRGTAVGPGDSLGDAVPGRAWLRVHRKVATSSAQTEDRRPSSAVLMKSNQQCKWLRAQDLWRIKRDFLPTASDGYNGQGWTRPKAGAPAGLLCEQQGPRLLSALTSSSAGSWLASGAAGTGTVPRGMPGAGSSSTLWISLISY